MRSTGCASCWSWSASPESRSRPCSAALVARAALAPVARFTRRTEALTGRPRPVRAARGQGQGRARPAGAELQRDARRARAIGAGSAQPRRRCVTRASHPDRQPAREHPDARGRGSPARARAERASARTSSRSSTRSPRSSATWSSSRADASSAPPPTTSRSTGSSKRASRRRAGARATCASTRELEPTLVCGSPEQIDRAVVNLLDNAVKWSPPGGEIEVDAPRRRPVRSRLRAGLRSEGPPAPLRPLLPRGQRARAARLGARPRDRPPDGRGPRRLRARRERPRGGARLEVSFGSEAPPGAIASGTRGGDRGDGDDGAARAGGRGHRAGAR